MRLVATRTLASLVLLVCALSGYGARPQQQAIGILQPGQFVRVASSVDPKAARRAKARAKAAEDNVGDGAANTTADRSNTGIPPCTWVPAFFLHVGTVGLVLVILTAVGVWCEYKPPEKAKGTEDVRDNCPEHIGEDLFGLLFSSVVRNTHALATGTSTPMVRVLHIMTCVSLQMFSMVLQVYLLYFMNLYVAASAEESIRRNYDKYEVFMYGNDTNQMDITKNGYHRGHPQLFKAGLFDSLDPSIKDVVCHVPLSQPVFFATILAVWTLTCIQEFRFCFEHLWRFMINTPTVPTMALALEYTGEETKTDRPMEQVVEAGEGEETKADIPMEKAGEAVEGEETKTDPPLEQDIVGQDQGTAEAPEVMVIGLTMSAKLFVIIVQIVPRILVAVLSLWLGCIWLCATADFENLVTNVVALAFITQLKDLIFFAVAPKQAQQDAANTLVKPLYMQGSANLLPYFGSFAWLALCFIWVGGFIHFQPVLPGYMWDVRAVCEKYLHNLANPLNGVDNRVLTGGFALNS